MVSSTRAVDAMDVDSEKEQDGQPDAQSDEEDESEDEKEADERPRTRCLRGVGVESPYDVKLEVLQRRGRPELELFKTHMSTCMPLIVDRAIDRESTFYTCSASRVVHEWRGRASTRPVYSIQTDTWIERHAILWPDV
jgi:hypothetical protein